MLLSVNRKMQLVIKVGVISAVAWASMLVTSIALLLFCAINHSSKGSFIYEFSDGFGELMLGFPYRLAGGNIHSIDGLLLLLGLLLHYLAFFAVCLGLCYFAAWLRRKCFTKTPLTDIESPDSSKREGL
ncbi:MAG: hypothetical protein RL639_394 [Verrucomicrobiota bacterium]|jgi:hypothetical protein